MTANQGLDSGGALPWEYGMAVTMITQAVEQWRGRPVRVRIRHGIQAGHGHHLLVLYCPPGSDARAMVDDPEGWRRFLALVDGAGCWANYVGTNKIGVHRRLDARGQL